MLILSRKSRQSIVIDGGITVTIVAVKGSVVQLGIEAPKDISVHRSEVYNRLRALASGP